MIVANSNLIMHGCIYRTGGRDSRSGAMCYRSFSTLGRVAGAKIQGDGR